MFKELPDSKHGALSKIIVPPAIMMANNEVLKIEYDSYTVTKLYFV